MCVHICFSQTLPGDDNNTTKAQTKTRNMKQAEAKTVGKGAGGRGNKQIPKKDIYFPSFKVHGSQTSERPWHKPYSPECV